MTRPRHAVYYAPAADTPLWRAASHVIGRDAVTDTPLPFPAIPPCDGADWAELTAEPRRYGFHGTLKAPFELAEGADEGLLLEAARAFAESRRIFRIEDPRVGLIGSFVAVVPGSANADLAGLAADCVVAFEPFRAPTTDADRARRPTHSLTPRQAEALERWGYPYVFEDFRFHMTLTGPLPEARRDAIRDELATFLDAILEPIVVDGIAVFRQEHRAAPFRLVARLPFGSPYSSTKAPL